MYQGWHALDTLVVSTGLAELVIASCRHRTARRVSAEDLVNALRT